jgi:Family of unknown function (DUF6932)
MSLPAFTGEGLLPAFDFSVTVDELRASYLVTGDGIDSPTWDGAWRASLVNNLEVLIKQLWQVLFTFR